MANENGARLRFRPAGSAARQHGAPEYGPLGTGCPAVEQAVTALYKAQNEESFWTLMNALNYALELDTRVLVPLQAARDSEKGGASWAEHPVPAEKARDLPLWTLRTQKGKNYLPIFTSVKTAEADRGTAARPMAELLLVDAMQKVLDSKEMDGIVLDPWTTSATLDASLLNGLLHAGHNPEEPGDEEVEAGREAARAGDWRMAADHYDEAAQQGNAMGLSLLADCLYRGRGEMQNKTEARRMWRTAADHGEVLAMLSLGEDCAARGEAGKALLYYRKARQTAQGMPDIEYTPRICLRLAQAETRYVSAKKAMALAAEAAQGFAILAREKEPDAAELQAEAEQLLRELADPKPRNTAYNIDSLQLD